MNRSVDEAQVEQYRNAQNTRSLSRDARTCTLRDNTRYAKRAHVGHQECGARSTYFESGTR
eukprot:12068484-Alexandrium_andersonii.AAC.1